MASRAKRISKQEWKRNEHIIYDLYHIRGLPLCKKGEGEGESVQSILHVEHGFTASRAQLEAHVKSLDQPKNLKKEEWRAVHLKLGELLAMKIEARVKLCGKVFSKEQLQRSQRHAFSGYELSRPSSSDGHTLPYPKSIVIETQGADGEWSIYAGENAVVGTNSSPSTNDLAIWAAEEPVLVAHPENNAAHQSGLELSLQSRDPATNKHSILGLEGPPPLEYIDEHQDRFLINYPTQRYGSPWLGGHDPHTFHDLDLPAEMGGFDRLNHGYWQPPVEFFSNWPGLSTFEDSFSLQYSGQESPFSLVQTAISATPTRSSPFETQSLQYTGVDARRETALDSLSLPSPTSLVKSLLQSAAQVLIGSSMPSEVQMLPDPEDVLDSLLSLLPNSMQRDNSGETGEIATKNAILDSPFYSALLYSLMNGFAGLRNIPAGAIFRMLKQHHMGLRIIECLKSCPPTQAKCMADNLFRAAVEACDEEAIIFILQATRDSPNAIDPNEIVCRLDSNGRLYTPIELAAKFRHLGIVKILLVANADVNKTYDQNYRQEHGALELAIRKWGDFEAVDMNLVRTILHCHAEVRLDLIGAIIRWGQADLIQELMSRFASASHRECFQSDRIIEQTAQYLENDVATSIIKQIFDYCQSTNCMRCSADHQKLIERTLCTAAKRANFKLVELLLPHTPINNGGLAAAVRSGRRELIDIFLLRGASVGGPTCYLDNFGRDEFDVELDIPTTPLAEAIRSQDRGLVHEFENLGALSHINNEDHFEAAIFAAAEIGDCHYMNMLLQHVPNKRGEDLTPALIGAIGKDRTEAALLLLDNGANVHSGEFSLVGGLNALSRALLKQNRIVVDVLLEADVDVKFRSRTVVENAVLWGDMSIVEDLILLGADFDAGRNDTALTAAVKSRKKDLAKLLLKSGASPSARTGMESSRTPLAAAIENEDDDMIQLLISYGADPADDYAFLSAIEKNREIFNQLLRAFTSRYPDGKVAFGGNLLIAAVERSDAALLNRMLTAKFDVKSFAEKKNYLLTALGFSIIYGKHSDECLAVVRALIKHGDTNSIVQRSSRPPFKNSIVQRSSRSPFKNSISQKTALLVAVEARSEYMVKLLLEKGADVHRPARRGLKRTPLQQACEIGSFKMVKLLLEHKANVNEEPAYRGGATALQLAAISGSIKIAELLLSHGARVHAAPAKVGGRTAFEGAAEHGCVEMIRVLWNAEAGTGFTLEEIEKAKNLALGKGHRGCAEYIDSLSSATSFPSLEM